MGTLCGKKVFPESPSTGLKVFRPFLSLGISLNWSGRAPSSAKDFFFVKGQISARH